MFNNISTAIYLVCRRENLDRILKKNVAVERFKEPD